MSEAERIAGGLTIKQKAVLSGLYLKLAAEDRSAKNHVTLGNTLVAYALVGEGGE